LQESDKEAWSWARRAAERSKIDWE